MGAEVEPTYAADVAPLIRRECLGCHGEDGIGPMRLDDYSSVAVVAPLVVEAVTSRIMPPWPPDRECRTFQHERGLSEAERETFARWFEAEMPEGEPSDVASPQGTGDFEATHTAQMLERYTPDSSALDDYRCFLLDLDFGEDVFLQGRRVVPGLPKLVHHVLLYAVDPTLVADAEALDSAHPGSGYTCFGGPLPAPETVDDSSADTSAISLVGLGGWVPGQVPFRQREGRGTFIPRGSRLIMQVHYSLLDDDPRPDDTYVDLILTEEPPQFNVAATPLAILDLDIPAGAPHTRHQRVFRNYRTEAMRVTGAAPHMHLLGTEIRAEHVPKVGESGRGPCIVDIPAWDFHWQQSYDFDADETLVVEPGEGVLVSCSYDNSEERQPFVDGEQQEPRDVEWGESTLDEMCLVYLTEEAPWRGPRPIGCDAAEECLADCDGDEASCLLACEDIDGGCRVCVLGATLGCATNPCIASFFPAADCLRSCVDSYALIGGSYERCVRTECPDTADAALECLASEVEAGTCDAQLAECGVLR